MMSSSAKRKATTTLTEDERRSSAAKRSKHNGQSHEQSSTQSGEHNEYDDAGGPEPVPISPNHPINIQNGIYAAERLSCSFEVTHSINFILRGEIHLQTSRRARLTQSPMFQEEQYSSHGRTGKTLSERAASTSLTTCLTSSWSFS
jgi:hypothetical protein